MGSSASRAWPPLVADALPFGTKSDRQWASAALFGKERCGARYFAGQPWRRNRMRDSLTEEIQVSGAEDFDAVIETYHEALRAIISGDPNGYKALYSQAEDVTLANPFGGIARGRAEIEQRLDRAAANFRDGEVVGFETITRLVTPELAYLVEVERSKAKVGGSDELTRTDIRVTTLFRPEAGAWKVVHRHADPAVDAKPADTAFQR